MLRISTLINALPQCAFLAAILTVSVLSTAPGRAQAGCDDGSHRELRGDEPLASQLYREAQREGGWAWGDGTFHTEVFTYLGTLIPPTGPVLYVAYIETIWGPSCRATTRLIVFDLQLQEVGHYYAIDEPHFTDTQTLSIPYERTPETLWTFTGVLPECLEVSGGCFPLSRPRWRAEWPRFPAPRSTPPAPERR